MSQANPTQSGLLRRIVSSLLLLPFLLAVLYPFLWMIFGIFKTNREIYQPPVSYTHLTLPTKA